MCSSSSLRSQQDAEYSYFVRLGYGARITFASVRPVNAAVLYHPQVSQSVPRMESYIQVLTLLLRFIVASARLWIQLDAPSISDGTRRATTLLTGRRREDRGAEGV